MSFYFSNVPNFEYVSLLPDAQISDYIQVKNLFKRGRIREDIFQNLVFFEKYQIIGDERPDQVARKFYESEEYDWVVLLSNNILNLQSEWPMTQATFDKVMLEKYGSYEELYSGIHHYETTEVRNSYDAIIMPKGVQVDPNYSLSFYDAGIEQEVFVTNFTNPITNYQYEEQLENEKRNIFVLKPSYLNVIVNDIEDIMPYKKGSSQYVNATLKRGENIRLYT
jgi:hypothetical protein